jgi:presenilin-like A22 family membrane protease
MSTPASRAGRPGVIVTHPNREKAGVQGTRATVILLLLASAGLIMLVTVGGWSTLEGLKPVLIAWVLTYLVMAYSAYRWRRGVLPMAAALALLMLVFALVSAPSWFIRDKPGYAEPGLPASFLGVMTLVIVPVQLLMIAFAMRGFAQGWNVELEQLDPSVEGDALGHAA